MTHNTHAKTAASWLSRRVGSLRRRFGLLLVVLALASLVPWRLAANLHDHLRGFAVRLDVASTLRFRLVELGMVAGSSEADDPLSRDTIRRVEVEQRATLVTLIDGDPTQNIPACRIPAVCKRLKAYLARWNAVVVPRVEAARLGTPEARRRLRELLLGEVGGIDETVGIMAGDAGNRVAEIVGQGLAAGATSLILLVLVGYGVWEVFGRIRRLQEAGGDPVDEDALEAQGKGSDEVAALARALLTSMRSLRLRNDIDRRRAARLDRWQTALGHLAARLGEWIDQGGNLDAIVDAWAEAAGLAGAAVLRPDQRGHFEVPVADGPRELVLPLTWGEDTVGALRLVRGGGGPVSPETSAMGDAAARTIAIALVARGLLAEREERSAIAAELATLRHLEDGAPALAARLRAHIGHDAAAVGILDDAGVLEHAFTLGTAGAAPLARPGTPKVPGEVTRVPPGDPTVAALLGPDAGSGLIVPLVAEARPVGLLVLARTEPFTDRDAGVARALSRVLGSAVLRMRLTDRLLLTEQLATVGGFSRMVAHEVRNPLNSMGLHLKLLARLLEALPVPEETAARLDGHLTAVRSETIRLDQVVESYVTFGSGAGAARFEDVDLRSLVEGVLAVHGPVLEDREVEVDADLGDAPAIARVDRVRYQQAVHNLVLNALEAMPESGGRLRIFLEAHASAFALHVVDNGPGFADLGRIFAPSYTTKRSGSGMGLPVSLQIARLHGGSLTARRPEGGGAEVILTVARASAGRIFTAEG